MLIKMLDLKPFVKESHPITEDDMEYFKHYYGLDLCALDPRDQQIIKDFREHGASSAIMNLIYRLTHES